MTIEEKARAYDEALERCKEWASGTWGHSVDDSPKDIAEFIFPQLAESEDERIRKHLIDIVETYWGKTTEPGKAEDLAYLEKQKEPHFIKRNALFDKCVENCDPEIMKRVSDEVDEMLEKEQKSTECNDDERIRKTLIHIVKGACDKYGIKYRGDDITEEKLLAYLEKQKEQKLYWKPTNTDVALLNKAIITNNTLTPTERAQLDIIRSKFGYCRASNCNRIVQEKPNSAECSDDERIREDIVALIKFALNDGSAVSPGSYTTKEEALAYLEKQKKESLKDFIDDFPYSAEQEEHDWNKKPCLTCQEYEKGHKQGYTEGCTAGYNKAMKERTEEILGLDGNPICYEQKPAEINLKIFLTADRLASAEMTGRLKERSEILENPEKYGLQKSAEWSDEDERRRDGVIQWLREYQAKFNPKYDSLSIESIESLIDWLKSLHSQPKQEWSEDIIRKAVKEIGLTQHQIDWFKTNVFPSKVKWSEEDEGELQNAIDALEFLGKKGVYKSESGYNAALQAASWLKNLSLSLKKRNEDVAKLCSNEWSEEDEKMLDKVCCLITPGAKLTNDNADYCVELKQWIISLQERILNSTRPQSHWKPTEEQMKWLKDVLETVPMTCRQQVPLESLYNDLLKLADDCINTYHRTFIQEL